MSRYVSLHYKLLKTCDGFFWRQKLNKLQKQKWNVLSVIVVSFCSEQEALWWWRDISSCKCETMLPWIFFSIEFVLLILTKFLGWRKEKNEHIESRQQKDKKFAKCLIRKFFKNKKLLALKKLNKLWQFSLH